MLLLLESLNERSKTEKSVVLCIDSLDLIDGMWLIKIKQDETTTKTCKTWKFRPIDTVKNIQFNDVSYDFPFFLIPWLHQRSEGTIFLLTHHTKPTTMSFNNVLRCLTRHRLRLCSVAHIIEEREKNDFFQVWC